MACPSRDRTTAPRGAFLRRQSTVDYDGQSFKLVPAGTCTQIETPLGPGSLSPIQRPA